MATMFGIAAFSHPLDFYRSIGFSRSPRRPVAIADAVPPYSECGFCLGVLARSPRGRK